MAVLYTPHFVQFFENDGVTPAAGGLLYTYAAGTTTPKATYTTAAGDIELPNPVVLDSAGRAVIFITGSYKFRLTDSDGNLIKETDNITSFNASTANAEGFFQSFSGNAVTTAFTTSDSLGSDEKALMVFSELEYTTNGTFASDTAWTKGAGWTIAAGVATATGAISTAIEQSAGTTIVQGKQYLVQYTITRSAGSITPSLGGTAGTARSASGTYSETIIAGSTQVVSFGTSGFTGTLDNVSVRDVGGLSIRNPGDYTIDGTTLTFNRPPATGTNNIFVFAPYTLINAAGAAQTAADAAIAAQAAAEAAVNAVAYQFVFDSSTTMADPGTGDFRLNNATLSSVTAIAVDALSSVTGNPDVSDAIAAWGASTSTNKGQIKITKSGTPATFALYNVTAAVTDNTGWLELTVSHVDSNGTFSASDVCYLEHSRTGDKGDTGATGSVTATSAVTASTSGGAVLEANGGTDCLQWGAGGGANVTILGGFSINGSSSAAASIFLHEDTDNGTNSIQLIAPASIASNRVITFPDSTGTVALLSDVTGGGWVPIKTVTASASSTIDFVNGTAGVVLDSTYKAYAVVITSLVPATDTTLLYLRTSTNTGSSYDAGASDYSYVTRAALSTGTSGTDASTGAAFIPISDAGVGIGNDTNEDFSAIVYLHNLSAATKHKKTQYYCTYNNGAGAVALVRGSGSRLAVTDVDAIRFLMSSGNITSGTFTLYGLKDA